MVHIYRCCHPGWKITCPECLAETVRHTQTHTHGCLVSGGTERQDLTLQTNNAAFPLNGTSSTLLAFGIWILLHCEQHPFNVQEHWGKLLGSHQRKTRFTCVLDSRCVGVAFCFSDEANSLVEEAEDKLDQAGY